MKKNRESAQILLKTKRGKAFFSEVSVLLVLVIAAVIAMLTYIKRATQGRILSYSQQLGFSFFDEAGYSKHLEISRNVVIEHRIVNVEGENVLRSFTNSQVEQYEREGSQVGNL